MVHLELLQLEGRALMLVHLKSLIGYTATQAQAIISNRILVFFMKKKGPLQEIKIH